MCAGKPFLLFLSGSRIFSASLTKLPKSYSNFRRHSDLLVTRDLIGEDDFAFGARKIRFESQQQINTILLS